MAASKFFLFIWYFIWMICWFIILLWLHITMTIIVTSFDFFKSNFFFFFFFYLFFFKFIYLFKFLGNWYLYIASDNLPGQQRGDSCFKNDHTLVNGNKSLQMVQQWFKYSIINKSLISTNFFDFLLFFFVVVVVQMYCN